MSPEFAEMSDDGEDDFMCEEEEDYGLVSQTFVLYVLLTLGAAVGV